SAAACCPAAATIAEHRGGEAGNRARDCQDECMSNDPTAVAHVSAGDLDVPEELNRRTLRSRLLIVAVAIVVVAGVVTLVPGLSGLRSRLAHANAAWLGAGVVLKLLSGVGYVAVFRMIFCRRMSWRVSTQVGMSELGANAILPAGGAGGLALGAWALRRGGMDGREIACRTVAFFLLTSVPNVLGVIVIGFALAAGVLGGERNLLLTALPAALALGAVLATLVAGRLADRASVRLAGAGDGAGGTPSRRARALRESLIALADGVRESLALLREGDAVLITGLIAYLVFDIAILWAGFRALGAAPPLAVLALAYLIGELGGLVPLPGGIGGVDAGLLGTLVLYHVSITTAAGAVLAYRAVALVVPALAGALAFHLLRRTLRDEASQLAVCAPDTEMEIIGVGRAVIDARR
ncbi:MAG TPA: lysylphosphatidylglycerol synthase transmembrane domain-containing protein, partial [Solirubrobacteraceae bacterium]|nr:lysylphosphatidylglycerol synthase transmembrane domain-containing protein [Solirubrobacteraceae bacterium]